MNYQIETDRQGLTITNDSKFIYITSKKITDNRGEHLRFVTDYTPELFNLIANSRIRWQFEVYDKTKKRAELIGTICENRNKAKIRFGRFVYGYYHFGLTCENLFKAIRGINEYFSKQKLEIEHLYPDGRNNIRANLSVTSGQINRQKERIDGRLIANRCVSVFVNNGMGEFRAIIFQVSGFVRPIADIRANCLNSFIIEMQKALSCLKLGKPKKKRVIYNYWELQRYLCDHYSEGDVKEKLGLKLITGVYFNSEKRLYKPLLYWLTN